jgi:excisionase family DNA binding protein
VVASTNTALLDIDQVAEYLNISKHTIYGWRQTGSGPPAIKIGGQLRYRLADLEIWLDEQKEVS